VGGEGLEEEVPSGMARVVIRGGVSERGNEEVDGAGGRHHLVGLAGWGGGRPAG
jgi:hypothetical protein